MSTTGPAFEVDHVSISFGGLKAVDDFCMMLEHRALHGLIGPNGAGKTTAFNLITGVYQPDTGHIRLGGRELTGLKPSKIAAAGIARTFQNIRLFPDLTVADNVRIGCHVRKQQAFWQSLLCSPRHWRGERAMTEQAMELLAAFNLAGRAEMLAGNLPYGDQRRLEICRALATQPKLLLLDEPAAGMNSGEKAALRELIRELPARHDITVLLIEHDMSLVMGVCEAITVLDHGQIIATGAPEAIRENPKVIEAYLGEPMESATDAPA